MQCFFFYIVFSLSVECHPYFQQPKLRAYLKSKGTVLSFTASRFHKGWNIKTISLSTIKRVFCLVHLAPSYVNAGIELEAYAPLGSPSRFGIDPNDPIVMEDPLINEIATKYGVTPAQVIIDSESKCQMNYVCYDM